MYVPEGYQATGETSQKQEAKAAHKGEGIGDEAVGM